MTTTRSRINTERALAAYQRQERARAKKQYAYLGDGGGAVDARSGRADYVMIRLYGSPDVVIEAKNTAQVQRKEHISVRVQRVYLTGQSYYEIIGYGDGTSYSDDGGATSTAGIPPVVVGGDLSGSLPSPSVVGWQGNPLDLASPSTDDVPSWNGSAWVPVPQTGGGGGALADGDYGDVVVSGTGTVLTVESAAGAFALKGDITPTALSGDVDDWNPTGLADAAVIRISSSTDVNITGLAGGADGRIIVIENIGFNNITLTSEDGASTAANQFLLNTNVLLLGLEIAVLQYDATTARWRSLIVPSVPSSTIVTIYVNSDNIGAGDELNFIAGDGVFIVGTQGTPTDPVDLTIQTVIDKVDLTGQTADISPANLANVSANGLYRLSWYLVPTTTDGAAGAAILTFAWNDGASQTHAESPVVLTAGGEAQGVEVVYRASGNISYAISHTGSFVTAAYALRIRLEFLG